MICKSNICTSGGGIIPSGTINITENGTVDVTDYAQADVQVSDRMKGYIEGTLTLLVDDTITSVRQYAIRNSSITTVSLPNCTSLSSNAFYGASLRNVYLPKITSIPLQCFNSNGSNLGKIAFQKVTSISTYVFGACSSLRWLIFEVNQVVSLGANNSFNNTPFNNAYGSATGGTLYVPYTQVSNYESNGTWNPKTNGVPNYNRTFKSIQENLVELQELDVYKFELSDYYTIVNELPTSDIDDTIVYFIETATSGTYEQWFHGSGSWEQLPNITLESEETI